MPVDAILFLLTGSIAGFSAGLLGIGGGLIIVPVLYFVFESQNIEQTHLMHMALATSLATIIFTSISSAYAHHKKQAVLWRLFILLAPGICIGAWLGGTFASRLDTSILKPVFACFELLVAAHLLSQHKSGRSSHNIHAGKASGGGLLIGFISSIVGIGGGTLTVPFLHWHNINIRKSVATSAACGLPIALFGTASYIYSGWNIENPASATLGYVALDAFILIIITSFLFAPLGAKLAHSLPEKTLKMVFGCLLLLISFKMLLG